MREIIDTLNIWGRAAADWAWPVFWQSSVLIAVLWLLDLALRRRVPSVLRYALSLLVLLKLVLPPSLAFPTGPAYWHRLPAKPAPTVITQSTVTELPPDPAWTIEEMPALPEPVPAPAPPPRLQRHGWLLLVWIAGGIALLGIAIRRTLQVRALLQNAVAAPEALSRQLADACATMDVRRRVELRVTPATISPALCGLRRPTILIPEKLLNTLEPAQLRTVLLHELAHLKRHDLWVNLIQTFLQIGWWWHPLLWFANAHIRRLREQAVDERVMASLDTERETYPRALLAVARECLQRPTASLGLVGIIESRGALKLRISRLLDENLPRRTRLGLPGTLVVIAAGALLLPMARGQAPSTPESSASVSALTAAAGSTNSQSASTDTQAQYKADSLRLAERVRAAQLALQQLKAKLNITIEVEAALQSLEVDHLERLFANESLESYRPWIPLQRELENARRELDTLRLTTIQQQIDGQIESGKTLPNLSKEETERQRILAHQRNLESLNASIEAATRRADELRQKLGVPSDFPATLEASDLKSLAKFSPYLAAKRDADSLLRQRELLTRKIADEQLGFALVSELKAKGTSVPPSLVASQASPNAIQTTNGPTLLTRAFVVEPLVLTNAMLRLAGHEPPISSDDTIQKTLIRHLSNLGVPFEQTNRALFYSAPRSNLFVRATGTELEIVEHFLSALIQPPWRPKAPDTSTAPASSNALKTNLPSLPPSGSTNSGSPKAAVTNTPGSPSPNRARIIRALDDIRLPRVSFDATPLHEVIRKLADESAKLSPPGLNFILMADPQLTGIENTNPPITGEELINLPITIQPPVENQPLAHVLELIVSRAERPIMYSVEDYAIVFTGKRPPPVQLYTRSYVVDLTNFTNRVLRPAGLSDSSSPEEQLGAVRRWFTENEVNLDPPANVFFNPGNGNLLVRCIEDDLEKVNKLVLKLNQPPRQLLLETRVVDVPAELFTKLWNQTGMTNPAGASSGTAVLSPAQAGQLLAELQADSKVKIQEMPGSSGRLGGMRRIAIGDALTVVNGINPAALTPPGIPKDDPSQPLYTITNHLFGPKLDIKCAAGKDDFTIGLEIAATVSGFHGYFETTNEVPVYVGGERSTAKRPLPRIEEAVITCSATLRDGQTLILGGPVRQRVNNPIAVQPPSSKRTVNSNKPVDTDLPFVGRFFRSEARQAIVHRLIFISPRIVDETGQPVHSEEELK